MLAKNVEIVCKSCRGKGIASRLAEKRGFTDFAPIWGRPRPWQHPITTQLQNQLMSTSRFSKPLAPPFLRKPHMARKYSNNWLRVLGTTERPQVDQGIRHQLHPIVPLLDTFQS
jgi:hypothetical protein